VPHVSKNDHAFIFQGLSTPRRLSVEDEGILYFETSGITHLVTQHIPQKTCIFLFCGLVW